MTGPNEVVRTRTSYDTVADDYAELLRDELGHKPLDRALLATFAELVTADGGGPVLDLGCGPGRISDYLHQLGLDVSGVDLSPGMVAVAQRDYPHLRFDVGELARIPVLDSSLAGIVAWYSIIHTTPGALAAVFAEFARVLRTSGHLLLAFQTGDDQQVHRVEAYGHQVDLTNYRHLLTTVEDALVEAGLRVTSRTVREPAPLGFANGNESSRQAYVLAQAAESLEP